MALPPSDAGAVHVRATEESAGVPDTAVGAPATDVPGVTAADGDESGPVPAEVMAATVKV